MAKIQSVTGPLAPADVGITLTHEHMMFGITGWDLDPTLTFDREARLADATDELRELKAAGASLVVDLTAIASGRDVDFMARASRDSGVSVVACTGFWTGLGMPGHFERKTVEELEQLFVQELTRGMGTTDVPAGIIKVGTMDPEMSEPEHRLFQAAARASKRTGAAVSTHVPGAQNLRTPEQILPGREHLKVLLEEEGMDPGRVVIGHCDATNLPEWHLEVARTGAYVAFDHCTDEAGAPYSAPDEGRVQFVLALLEAGYEEQLLLSTDRISHSLSRAETRQAFTYASLLTRFLPMLREAGVSEETLHNVMVENPRRLLSMPD